MFALILVISVLSFLGFWLFKNKSYGSLVFVVLVSFISFQGLKVYWSVDVAVQPFKVASLKTY